MKLELSEIVDALNLLSKNKQSKTLAERMQEEEKEFFQDSEDSDEVASYGEDCETCNQCDDSSEDLNILAEAYDIVEGQRRKDYGDMSASFQRIAGMWSAYSGCNFDSYDVANMMIMLKLSRAHGKGFQRESFVDVCGYAYCAEKMADNETENEEMFSDY